MSSSLFKHQTCRKLIKEKTNPGYVDPPGGIETRQLQGMGRLEQKQTTYVTPSRDSSQLKYYTGISHQVDNNLRVVALGLPIGEAVVLAALLLAREDDAQLRRRGDTDTPGGLSS